MINIKIKDFFSKLIYKILELLESITGNFFIIKLLPIRIKNKNANLPVYKNIKEEFVILMQGPLVHKNDFTLETLSFYRSVFPNVKIILSTWDSECSLTCKKIEKTGVDILTSELPQITGISNVNLQLISTNAAINYLGDENQYILKTRTDHRIYSSDNWLAYLRKKCEMSIPGQGLEKKLLICNLNMFQSRKYVVSDMFMFGKNKDMKCFWDVSHQKTNQDTYLDNDIFGFHGAETHIMNKFLKLVRWNILKTRSDSDEFLHSYFSIIDKDVLELFWFKYNHFYDRKFKTVDNGRSRITSVINFDDS